MKFFATRTQLASVQALFASANIDLAGLLAKNDPDALRAHLATLATGQPDQAAIDAAVNEKLTMILKASDIIPAAGQDAAAALQTALTEADEAVTAAESTTALYVSALAKTGIKPAAADTSKGLQETDITKAINDRISIKASEQLAGHGTPILGNIPTATPSTPKKTASTGPDGKELTGVARTAAAFKGKIPAIQ